MNGAVIETIARAIITDETKTKILFCAPTNHAYFYLPGGHVEFGESAASALVREFREETGVAADEGQLRFIGAAENIFMQGNELRHKINIYFEAGGIFSGNEEPASLEKEISFHWLKRKDIRDFPVLPEELKNFLSEWTPGKRLQNFSR